MRTRQEWTVIDDDLAAKLYEEGLSPRDIAGRMARPVGTVSSKLTQLRKAGRIGQARGRGGRRPGGPERERHDPPSILDRRAARGEGATDGE